MERNDYSVRNNRSTIDQIITIKHIMEKCCEFDHQLLQIFIDFKHAGMQNGTEDRDAGTCLSIKTTKPEIFLCGSTPKPKFQRNASILREVIGSMLIRYLEDCRSRESIRRQQITKSRDPRYKRTRNQASFLRIKTVK